MFDKVVARAFKMVREQIKRAMEENKHPVNLIILCGGMADSKYVQNRFDQFCKDELEGKSETIVPRDSWSAIARGAVLHALKPSMVGSRKSRWSYGIEGHRAFDSNSDCIENRYDCPVMGPRGTGYIAWFIHRARNPRKQKLQLKVQRLIFQQDDIVKDKVKWIHGYITIPNNGAAASNLLLYRSKSPTPGDRVNGQGVEQFAKLNITTLFQGSETKTDLMIGHKIDVNEKTVQFEAKSGRKTLGRIEVEYKEDEK
ncbi:hypothetical protein AJ78_04614 [Emergomyces pasteurianus Ep9510]|uniref:Hsp70-like protein n=1 Tax=Emergomyces pasteurianus Ep9510 TaxID=1447872 RepID=A0A1J9PF32_9EURO|nr:hypothetical protein AJ78_04614 [Emergomyces pasteurianus Ep9510]